MPDGTVFQSIYSLSDLRANDDILTRSASVGADATLQRLFPQVEDSSRLTVCCPRFDYSASRIARAVEDCDAHLLNLNVTSAGAANPFGSGEVAVEIRVSHRNASAVARSLERYGYRVVAVEHAQGADDPTMRDRVNELIHYLGV